MFDRYTSSVTRKHYLQMFNLMQQQALIQHFQNTKLTDIDYNPEKQEQNKKFIDQYWNQFKNQNNGQDSMRPENIQKLQKEKGFLNKKISINYDNLEEQLIKQSQLVIQDLQSAFNVRYELADKINQLSDEKLKQKLQQQQELQQEKQNLQKQLSELQMKNNKNILNNARQWIQDQDKQTYKLEINTQQQDAEIGQVQLQYQQNSSTLNNIEQLMQKLYQLKYQIDSCITKENITSFCTYQENNQQFFDEIQQQIQIPQQLKDLDELCQTIQRFSQMQNNIQIDDLMEKLAQYQDTYSQELQQTQIKEKITIKKQQNNENIIDIINLLNINNIQNVIKQVNQIQQNVKNLFEEGDFFQYQVQQQYNQFCQQNQPKIKYQLDQYNAFINQENEVLRKIQQEIYKQKQELQILQQIQNDGQIYSYATFRDCYCPLCLQNLKKVRISCGHFYCEKCAQYLKNVSERYKKCPLCDQPYKGDDMIVMKRE